MKTQKIKWTAEEIAKVRKNNLYFDPEKAISEGKKIIVARDVPNCIGTEEDYPRICTFFEDDLRKMKSMCEEEVIKFKEKLIADGRYKEAVEAKLELERFFATYKMNNMLKSIEHDKYFDVALDKKYPTKPTISNI